MSYDWTPTASRSVTTTGQRAVVPPPAAVTMAAVIEEFIEAAEKGDALNRSGRHYLPSALRDLRGILRLHVAPALGDRDILDVRRADIQALVDGLARDGLSESRIRSVISALRALYGHAIERGYVEFNPADGLTMPDMQERASEPDEAERKPQPAASDDDYEPIAQLPERLVSLALRAAIVVFAVIAIVSLLQPA
jgi:site-specific recombinase XerC